MTTDLEGAVERAAAIMKAWNRRETDLLEANNRYLERARAAEAERDAMREATSEAVEALRTEIRANEMSANIMRDPARTGGWRGAENVAKSYDRHALKLSAIKAKLSAALVNGEPDQ